MYLLGTTYSIEWCMWNGFKINIHGDIVTASKRQFVFRSFSREAQLI